MERIKKDVCIIGSGPAGLSAGIYLNRANIDCVVFEKAVPGGKVNTATKIENYAGIAGVSGAELAFKMYEHAVKTGVSIASEEISDIQKENDKFIVKSKRNEYECYVVIVASGLQNKKLQLKNETSFEGRGVSYCATCDGIFFKGKDVAVIGNDDIAINDALYLCNLCNKVYFITKIKDEFVLEKLSSQKNMIVFDGVGKEIKGENRVSSLVFENESTLKEIEVSGVFPLGEETTNLHFLLNLGVDFEKGFIKVNKDMSTNVKGLYAAGDVTNNPLKQIISAASDGAVAATSSVKYVRGVKNGK